ncbi:hypothetical protein BASA60_005543 [Batrachochytrium salamandrivorans]|nr:hypothetical protein BASA60_005543 [Batrachochytrium salamandrivorans]
MRTTFRSLVGKPDRAGFSTPIRREQQVALGMISDASLGSFVSPSDMQHALLSIIQKQTTPPRSSTQRTRAIRWPIIMSTPTPDVCPGLTTDRIIR